MAAAEGLFVSSLGRWRTASITIHGKNCHARKTTKIHVFHNCSRFLTREPAMHFDGCMRRRSLTNAYGVQIDDVRTVRPSGEDAR